MPPAVKSPLASGAGGLFFNPAIDSGRSVQAIAVRRHVGHMMVVMTVMEVDLHL